MKLLKGVFFGSMVASLSLVPFETFAGQDSSAGPLDGGRIYSSMAAAMRSLPPVGPLSYKVNFSPHGMVVALRSSGHEAPHVALVFSPNLADETLEVKEAGGNQIEVREPQTGRRYVGRHVFWAVTWNDARTLDTRKLDDGDKSGLPTPQSAGGSEHSDGASSSGAIAGADDARSKIIGEVTSTVDRYYAISLSPDSSDATYHLVLKARTDPTAHPLTDVYIDSHTYLPTKIVGNFRNEAYVSGYGGVLTLSFEMVQTHWIITSGTIEARGHFLLTKFGGKTDFSISDLVFLN